METTSSWVTTDADSPRFLGNEYLNSPDKEIKNNQLNEQGNRHGLEDSGTCIIHDEPDELKNILSQRIKEQTTEIQNSTISDQNKAQNMPPGAPFKDDICEVVPSANSILHTDEGKTPTTSFKPAVKRFSCPNNTSQPLEFLEDQVQRGYHIEKSRPASSTGIPEVPISSNVATDPLERYRALINRKQNELLQSPYNALNFYAAVRLTPMCVKKGAYQVVSCQPGLKAQKLSWLYSFVSHGKSSHKWSLIPTASHLETTSSVRPIATLETWGHSIKSYESQVNDLLDCENAQTFNLSHYWDSYRSDGCHIGFKIDDDFRFEWKREMVNNNLNENSLYLWRISTVDDKLVTPVARFIDTSFISNPIDDSDLWSIEVDTDLIPAHIALVSAFNLKVSRARSHSIFAPRSPNIKSPTYLNNFSFQDDDHIYYNIERYWENNSSPKSEDNLDSAKKTKPHQIFKVFNGLYLQQIALRPEVIKELEIEMRQRIEIIKVRYSI